MIEIEGECGCDADRREEGVGASIIAGRDAPPILEPRKHDLDFVALLIERLVIGQRDFPAFDRGNAGFAASFGESFAEPIAVITTVGEKRFGGWQGIEDQPRPLVIAHLPFAEHEDEGLAFAVADRMELRVQAAFGAPDTAGNSPFFNRLAAVRCAFRWVASIMMDASKNWPSYGVSDSIALKESETSRCAASLDFLMLMSV